MTRTLACALLTVATLASAACGGDMTTPPDTTTRMYEADAAAPPVLLMQVRIARADYPTRTVSSRFTSPYLGDAGDRPGPFVFPFAMSLTVDPTFAGPVVITMEGLDWDTNAVIATGTTTADVVAQHETQAIVRLLRP